MGEPCSWAPGSTSPPATTPPPLLQTGTVGGRAGGIAPHLDNRTAINSGAHGPPVLEAMRRGPNPSPRNNEQN